MSNDQYYIPFECVEPDKVKQVFFRKDLIMAGGYATEDTTTLGVKNSDGGYNKLLVKGNILDIMRELNNLVR